ncbi:uncharacterized protein LOC112962005 [Apteryx rowi]|uniref:uncharacterized protein LOC112962005 n=1 Tax=Apteryx rowi TaxID=308060 RepID=UPI000E1DAAB5|nr:uncharacterized protein LOC112962005 [Apteryx rowi]
MTSLPLRSALPALRVLGRRLAKQLCVRRVARGLFLPVVAVPCRASPDAGSAAESRILVQGLPLLQTACWPLPLPRGPADAASRGSRGAPGPAPGGGEPARPTSWGLAPLLRLPIGWVNPYASTRRQCKAARRRKRSSDEPFSSPWEAVATAPRGGPSNPKFVSGAGAGLAVTAPALVSPCPGTRWDFPPRARPPLERPGGLPAAEPGPTSHLQSKAGPVLTPGHRAGAGEESRGMDRTAPRSAPGRRGSSPRSLPAAMPPAPVCKARDLLRSERSAGRVGMRRALEPPPAERSKAQRRGGGSWKQLRGLPGHKLKNPRGL